jgi:hypothetical protein
MKYMISTKRLVARREFTGFEDGAHRLAVRLDHTMNTEKVFWSEQANSYVVNDNPTGWWTAPGGVPCDLYSINGMGEARWIVSSESGNTAGDLAAAEYFGLTWHGHRGER